jgi:hypothetical protein
MCISLCEYAIELRSLLHHQLSAPLFGVMFHFAFYTSKLTSVRYMFSIFICAS